MTDIPALIARVGALTGPDREVDFWISARVFDSCDYSDAELQADIDVVGIEGMVIEAPFTSSVDAAIALVERVLSGWSWECRASGTGDKGQATVWNPLRAPGSNQEQRAWNMPSPALALVLAALKALQAQEAERGE